MLFVTTFCHFMHVKIINYKNIIVIHRLYFALFVKDQHSIYKCTDIVTKCLFIYRSYFNVSSTVKKMRANTTY